MLRDVPQDNREAKPEVYWLALGREGDYCRICATLANIWYVWRYAEITPKEQCVLTYQLEAVYAVLEHMGNMQYLRAATETSGRDGAGGLGGSSPSSASS